MSKIFNMTNLLQFQSLFYWLIIIAIIVWQMPAVKEILSDGKILSSKRVISISAMGTLIWVIYHCVTENISTDKNIMIGLVTLVIAVPIITSIPDIITLVNAFKGITKPEDKPVN